MRESIEDRPVHNRSEVQKLARYGPHGHEIVGEEIQRIRCSNCGNRVTFEAGDEEVKCPHCGNLVKRPRPQKS